MAVVTKASIAMDYTKAKRQADQIDTIANNLTRLSNNDFASSMQNISANWKGENASGYLRKGAILQGDISQTAKNLHAIASDLRSAALRIYKAEMQALAIAQERKKR